MFGMQFLWSHSWHCRLSDCDHNTVVGIRTYPDYLLDFYFPYALMQTFPEGFITGTVLALPVVYKPEWVATFRNEFYLHHQHPRDAHHLPKRRLSDD